MNKKKIIYIQSGYKTNDNLALWKYIRDENNKDIYWEKNRNKQIIFFI